MSAVLEAEDLSKKFGKLQALEGLNLKIPAGGVYGVFGPHGAGKSTLVRIWLGLVRASDGSARVFDAPAGNAKALRRVGSLVETPRFPPFMSGRDVLVMLSKASGLKKNDERIDELFSRVGLTEAAGRRTAGYSIGERLRLGIAGALLAQPELLILDEPTSGMDAAGVNEVRSLLRGLADKDGVTVVVASRYPADLQGICDRAAVLAAGKLVSEGPVADLTSGQASQLRITGTPVTAMLKVLGKKGVRDGEAVLANIQRKEAADLIRRLVADKVNITEARWTGGDLENLFLQQTGEPRAQ